MKYNRNLIIINGYQENDFVVYNRIRFESRSRSEVETNCLFLVISPLCSTGRGKIKIKKGKHIYLLSHLTRRMLLFVAYYLYYLLLVFSELDGLRVRRDTANSYLFDENSNNVIPTVAKFVGTFR